MRQSQAWNGLGLAAKALSAATLIAAAILLAGAGAAVAEDFKSVVIKRGQSPRGNFEEPKVETSGGPKTEDRAPPPSKSVGLDKGSIVQGPRRLGTAVDPATPGAPDPGAQKGGSSAAAKTAKTYDVGIIPGANGCPSGAELLTIYMDDEDDNNANSSTGWIGATVQDQNTRFWFCRVDGTQFPEFPSHSYAVLQLGTDCPNNASMFSRTFHNETHQNNSSASVNISPNVVKHSEATSLLQFCLISLSFSGTASTQFPNLGVEYGVFAASDLPNILDSGSIHIDDQDKKNKNAYGGAYGSRFSETSKIVSGDINTDIHFVKVKSGAPVYGSLHSVNLNTSSVVGGSSCNGIVISVYLAGPARPGGQPVVMSSSDQNNAGIFEPKFFRIPEGDSSGSASCFMGTKKVKKKVTITVNVNGQPGYVNLDITKN